MLETIPDIFLGLSWNNSYFGVIENLAIWWNDNFGQAWMLMCLFWEMV